MNAIEFKDQLRIMIESGEYLYGEMIPSERKLADKYQLNRMGVKRAINDLVKDGLLYRVQGKGTFVQNRDYSKLDLGYLNESGNSGITAMVKSHGVKVTNHVLTRGIINGNAYFADKLRTGIDEPIYILHRVRYGNEEPIAVEYTYLTAKYFKGIQNIDFKNISLYDYMDSKGHMPIIFDQKFLIMEVTDKDQEYLKIKRRSPVYYFEFVGMDDGGEVVEYTESVMRIDKSDFRFTAKTNR